MKCPRDGSELQAVDVRGVELDKCHRCDGLWLDYGELKSIRNMKLDEIEEELGYMPITESPLDEEALEIIHRAAKKLRNSS